MDSKVSFISAVNDPAWAVSGGHADEVRKTVNGDLGPFWDEVEMLLPCSNLSHKPYIS
jgi:hypothetical protein